MNTHILRISVILRLPGLRASVRMMSALAFACLAITVPTLGAYANTPVAYQKLHLRGVYIHLITVDMNDASICVSPALSRKGVGSSETFGSFVSRLNPVAAITGTYFCTRTRIPVGDIVIQGKPVNSGFVGTTVCISANNKVEFKSLQSAREASWSLYPYAISSGPRLVTNGEVGVYPTSEGFHDGAIRRMARRTAIGITKSNKLLLVAVDHAIYLRKLAHIMHDLGAYNAVNLDGGSSTALQCKGRVIIHPARRLTNVIAVYKMNNMAAINKPKLQPISQVIKSAEKS